MASDPKNSNVFSLSMLHQVIDYIEKNLFTELTPAVIASHFFISESTLSSLFKVVCEMTIMEYIRNRRLTLAAEELTLSNTPIIELAYKYGYETPEAFTKAFTRFHGYPPSFIRRGFPVSKSFLPMEIAVTIQGGWKTINLTKSNGAGQEQNRPMAYNTPIANTGDITYQINTCTMHYKREWSILYSLADSLIQNQIPFKVDGKTMIFAHGLEIPLDKICLTFKWADEETVKTFFHSSIKTKYIESGKKFFDVPYKNMKIRCMFYGNCPGDDTDAFLYRNADMVQIDNLVVPVQSLEFYYNNAEKDTEYYKMVEARLGKHERL